MLKFTVHSDFSGIGGKRFAMHLKKRNIQLQFRRKGHISLCSGFDRIIRPEDEG